MCKNTCVYIPATSTEIAPSIEIPYCGVFHIYVYIYVVTHVYTFRVPGLRLHSRSRLRTVGVFIHTCIYVSVCVHAFRLPGQRWRVRSTSRTVDIIYVCIHNIYVSIEFKVAHHKRVVATMRAYAHSCTSMAPLL